MRVFISGISSFVGLSLARRFIRLDDIELTGTFKTWSSELECLQSLCPSLDLFHVDHLSSHDTLSSLNGPFDVCIHAVGLNFWATT